MPILSELERQSNSEPDAKDVGSFGTLTWADQLGLGAALDLLESSDADEMETSGRPAQHGVDEAPTLAVPAG